SVGSTSGDVLPRYALKTAGIAESEVNMNYSGGHPEALLALTNGTVDAAQLNSQTQAVAEEEGSFNPEDYRQIWTSDPIPNDPITISADADPELKKAVKDALLNRSKEDIAWLVAYRYDIPPGPLLKNAKVTNAPFIGLACKMGLSVDDI